MKEPADSPATMDEIVSAIEGLVFVSEDPIPLSEIQTVLGIDDEAMRRAIGELRSTYSQPGRGLRIEEVAGGLRISTAPPIARYLRKLARLRHRRRLSPAALETLAVIAYRQPVTTPEIESIRGVNPEGPLKTLLERGLVRVRGRKKVVGRPLMYGTSREFLIHFGLNSIEDLPPIEEFEKVLAGALEGDAPGQGEDAFADREADGGGSLFTSDDEGVGDPVLGPGSEEVEEE